MSAGKFTAGPWKVHPVAKTAVVGSSGFVVAACGGYSTNTRDAGEVHDELVANARLIAAAPLMYEALRGIAQVARSKGMTEADMKAAMRDIAEHARAALAAATGEA